MLGSPPSRCARLVGCTLIGLLLTAGAAPVRGQVDDMYNKSLLAAQRALEQYGRVDDPEQNRRLQEIAYRVAQASRFEKYPFSFYLIDIPEPNAFALPGGQIFITRGMLALDLDDDELAALLGHEIAHVALEHGTRIQRRAALLNGLSAALLIGAVAGSDNSGRQQRYPGEVYDAGGGDLVQGTAAASALVTELLIRNYSRTFEDEADLEGQRWAAGAGFDPRGAGAMMAKLSAAVPQDHSYGYWRTHPFSDLRVRSAQARGKQLKAQPEQDPADYRRETQRKLLAAIEATEAPELERLLEDSAVAAWPRGPAADAIRLARLHERRDRVMHAGALSRNYTTLIDAYDHVRRQVLDLDPDSSLPPKLETEIDEIRELRAGARTAFVEAWAAGVLQTEALEALLANYPDFDQRTAARLQLADRYARLERYTEAVDQYLAVIDEEPDSEAAGSANNALASLLASVDDLCALDKLGRQKVAPEIARRAGEELERTATSFSSLKAGADYLACSPSGKETDEVRKRLEVLAESRLADVLLHQKIGNGAKAVEGINDILTHAPWTDAADRLRREQRRAAGLEETPS